MAVTAHRKINHIDEVKVSQATRAMSRPCSHEVLTISQEWEELVVEKRELELKLQAYSKTAFLKEQQRIRKGRGDTLSAWVNRKSAMEEERRKLVEEKNMVEHRMMSIKERVKQESREKSDIEDPRRSLFEAMLKELKAIRALLEAR